MSITAGSPPAVGNAIDIVRQYLTDFLSSKWEAVEARLAEDCEIIDPLVPDPIKGKGPILDLLHYCHTWGEYNGEILNIFGDDRYVAAQLWISGSVLQAPEGMTEEVVGKKFAFAECDVFELDGDGLIVRETIYADVVTLQKQMGQEF